MGELAALWDYQETMDELKQKLSYTNLELELVRLQANQEMCKVKENVNQLHLHLQTVYKERDEARDQIQKLCHNFPSRRINSPIQIQANSSITESNSLSDRYDPFFDIVSSPDSSNLGPFIVDQGSLVIDTLVKGKILPQKGKLLQAVREAGPLLKTLFLAGPLPRWRNPPPVHGFQIPPVSEIIKTSFNSNLISSSEMGCGTSQMLFSNGSCFGSVEVSDNGLLGKRQRLQ